MTNRISIDNEDYLVSKKRADIYQRRLATAMHDKFTAENTNAPQPVFPAQRVAHEKTMYTEWRNAELEFDRYQNDLKEKFDKIKSSLKKQYTDILDMEKSLDTYEDEMTKLNANIDQLTARIEVGVAKASDMDVYNAQKIKLEADVAAKRRELELARFNLKADLKIGQNKNISLAKYDEKFIRYDDSRIEKLINESVEASFSVNSNVRKLEILKDERAIMLLWDREGTMMYNLQSNEISIKETEYSLINARKTEEAGLWSDYYNILNLEDAIEVERLNLKVAENDYGAVSVKLEHGLATPLEEMNSRIALENATAAVQTAINNYMRVCEDFEVRLK